MNTLGTAYLGAAWPFTEIQNGSDRPTLTIVATENDTSIQFTAGENAVEAGGPVPGIAPMTQSALIVLNAFDVIQIRPAESQYPITGTAISASAPVGVFGGHPCASVPYSANGIPCDHLEEQLLPLDAWGTEAILARYEPRPGYTAESENINYSDDTPDVSFTYDRLGRQ